MNTQEVKNKIDSISKYQNRYIKNDALNLCDRMLESNFLTKKGKNEVERIKAEIEKVENPWLWKNTPEFSNLSEIQDNINKLYRIVE